MTIRIFHPYIDGSGFHLVQIDDFFNVSQIFWCRDTDTGLTWLKLCFEKGKSEFLLDQTEIEFDPQNDVFDIIS